MSDRLPPSEFNSQNQEKNQNKAEELTTTDNNNVKVSAFTSGLSKINDTEIKDNAKLEMLSDNDFSKNLVTILNTRRNRVEHIMAKNDKRMQEDSDSQRSSREEFIEDRIKGRRQSKLTNWRNNKGLRVKSRSRSKSPKSPLKKQLSKIRERGSSADGSSKRVPAKPITGPSTSSTPYPKDNIFVKVPAKEEELGVAINVRRAKLQEINTKLQEDEVPDKVKKKFRKIMPEIKHGEREAKKHQFATCMLAMRNQMLKHVIPKDNVLDTVEIHSIHSAMDKHMEAFSYRVKDMPPQVSDLAELPFYAELSEEDKTSITDSVIQRGKGIIEDLKEMSDEYTYRRVYRALDNCRLMQENTLSYYDDELPEEVKEFRKKILSKDQGFFKEKFLGKYGCEIMFAKAEFPVRLNYSRYEGIEVLQDLGKDNTVAALVTERELYYPVPKSLEHLVTEEGRCSILYFMDQTDKQVFMLLYREMMDTRASLYRSDKDKLKLEKYFKTVAMTDNDLYRRLIRRELVVVNRYVFGEEAFKVEQANKDGAKRKMMKESVRSTTGGKGKRKYRENDL